MESRAFDKKYINRVRLNRTRSNYPRNQGEKGMRQRMPGKRKEFIAPLELPERLKDLTRRSGHDDSYRLETDEASASLTDLQRLALRWLSSFD